jgi:hypothetical protein
MIVMVDPTYSVKKDTKFYVTVTRGVAGATIASMPLFILLTDALQTDCLRAVRGSVGRQSFDHPHCQSGSFSDGEILSIATVRGSSLLPHPN